MRSLAPYIHTSETHNSHAYDWLVAILPVMIWSVYMFGARVISLCVIGALCALLIDFPIQYFIFKRKSVACTDVTVAIYGILAVFAMPVSVPLWLPMLSSVLVVLAKNVKGFRGKRLFNPFVFSAAVLNLVFPSIMTAFTRPFAYFSAFDFNIDPRLLENYRVLSPLQYMADGSVYEDGIMAQLYGYASGCIGEIAITAMIISLAYLAIRKQADVTGTAFMLVPILLLALSFPSDDAESNYYAFSVLFSGASVFLSVFALNESHTVPITKLGRIIVGVLAGALIFTLRKAFGGFEWGYAVILLLNVVSPFIEALTKPKQKSV